MPIIEYQYGSTVYQLPAFQDVYPIASFPASIRKPVLETSTTLRLPVELAAHAALGVVSLVCQPFANIQCPSYPPSPLSLFLMALSNTSGGKSAVDQRYLRAVVAFERKKEAEIEVAMLNYRAEMKIWEDDGRRLTREYRDAIPESVSAAAIRTQRLQHEKRCPVKPKKWELRYGEVSPQGLRDALVANHAVGILSPEAGPALLGMTLSQPATLSGYWSGEDRPVGLVSGNRRPVEPRLTMSLMTQEDRFVSYMKSRGADAFGTGLLARFLVVSPKTIEYPGQSTQINDQPEPMLGLFNQRVAEILDQTLPAPDERMTLKLSEAAKHFWKLFKEEVHNKLICGDYSENLKSFFRKIGQQATRLAALFHYFDGTNGDISPEAMKGAIALCEWYLLELIRVFLPYAPSQQQQGHDAAQQLLEWLQNATAEPFRYPKLVLGQYTERDLRNYSRIRGNPHALEDAINTLHRQGHIRVQIGPKGGRVIFYPALTAPIPMPVNHSFFGQQIQPNLNTTFNRTVMAAQNSSGLMPSLHTFGISSHLNQSMLEAPRSENTPNSVPSSDDVEYDSEQTHAVKQHLEKSAIEAGLGSIDLNVYYHRS